MRWVCVLVTSNVPKREKKRNQLAFLPNVQCNIENKFNFLAFFDTNMLVSKTREPPPP